MNTSNIKNKTKPQAKFDFFLLSSSIISLYVKGNSNIGMICHHANMIYMVYHMHIMFSFKHPNLQYRSKHG